MLVVLSQDKKRSLSGTLKQKFKDLYLKCMDEKNGRGVDYCIKSSHKPRLKRFGTGVAIIPSDNAKAEIKNKQPDFQIYEGDTTRESIGPEQFKIMDTV